MPGPPPKPDAQRRRRNATPTAVQLPSEGRRGDPPEWPLPRPKASELKVWRELWATPQAVAWERLGWVRTVARYTRVLVLAEALGADKDARSEARLLEDRLGLTPMSMLKLRWEIIEDELAERRGARPSKSQASKRRLMAVDPGAVARR